MDLATIFRILYRKIIYLVGIPVAMVILAFVLTAGYRNMYRSSAQIATGFTINKEVNLTAQRFSLYEADMKFSNLIETMGSSRVMSLLGYRLILHDLEAEVSDIFTTPDPEDEKAQAFLKEVDLDEMKTLFQNRLDSILNLNTHNADDRDAQKLLEVYHYDIKSLKNTIDIKRVKNTDYVSIDALTINPYLSANMVNTLCEEYTRFNSNMVSARTSNLVETFAKLVEEKRKELDKATRALQNFKSNNSMVNLELERENQISRVSGLQLELQEEKKKKRALTLQINDLNSRLVGLEDGERISNADLLEIKSKINSVNSRYRASGQKDKSLEDSLVVLRSIQQEYTRILSQGSSGSYDAMIQEKGKLEIDLEITDENILDLEESILRQSSEVGGFASKEARIAAFEREVNLAGEDYQEAQEKYNQALNVSIASSNTIAQVQLGLPALKPEPSKRLIVSAIAGVSTFVFIVLVIILLEYLDLSIKNRTNFENQVSSPVVGVINHINLKKTDVLDIFNTDLSKNKNLLTFRDQLRKLRHFLLNSDKKSILFTSTKEKEGKSLIIKSLAVSISKSQAKVLIIDTNFSHKSLTDDLNGSADLEGFLSGEKQFNLEMIKNSGVGGVDILGCTGGNHTPIEIVKGDRLAKLVEKMKGNYDFIFLEGAALNNNADSRELSEVVDGVVNIFSAKSSLGQLDFDSIDFLSSMNGKFLGAVLSDVELREMKE